MPDYFITHSLSEIVHYTFYILSWVGTSLLWLTSSIYLALICRILSIWNSLSISTLSMATCLLVSTSQRGKVSFSGLPFDLPGWSNGHWCWPEIVLLPVYQNQIKALFAPHDMVGSSSCCLHWFTLIVTNIRPVSGKKVLKKILI